MSTLIAILILLSALKSHCIEENWPPPNVNLSDDPKLWPGHMESLGSKFPKKKVEVRKNFPSVEDFFNEYVISNNPLLIKGVGMNLSNLTEELLLDLSYSYTTVVEVRKKGEDNIFNMTVRKFLKRYKDEDLYLDISIPIVLKSQMPIPHSIQCQSVLKELKKSKLVYRNGEWYDALKANEEHSIFCQLEGKAELLLINFVTFPKKTQIMDFKNGTESAVDVKMVNYEKYPALREVPEYYVATVTKSDCIFIPGQWLYQLSSHNKSVSTTIFWNKKTIVPSSKTCGQPKMKNMAQLTFPNDTDMDLLSLISFANLHNFIEEYIPRSTSKLTYEEFKLKLKKDPNLKKLVNWNEECDKKGHELFQQMDTNKDNFISSEDLDKLNIEQFEQMAEVLNDRYADFDNIITSQVKEKKDEDSNLDISKSFKKEYDKEIQKILEEGFNEVFQESNIPGKLTFSETGEPIIQMDDKQPTETKNTQQPETEDVEEIIADEEMKKIKEFQKKIEQIKTKKLSKDEL